MESRKISNDDVGSAVLQSVLAADLHRAMARQETAKDSTALTKAELSENLFEQVGLNKREAKDLVEAFFEDISNLLIRGEEVKLIGFGNFQLRDKPQRSDRNLKTGMKSSSLPAELLRSNPAKISKRWSPNPMAWTHR